MAELGTTYMVEVIIESEMGVPMSELDFTVSFMVYSNRRIEFSKEELRSVKIDGIYHYYACVDSSKVGNGRLRVRAIIKEDDCACEDGRYVVITAPTPIFIGGRDVPIHRCDTFDNGYRLTVNTVAELPQSDDYDVYMGIIHDNIASMGEINEEMIFSDANDVYAYNVSDKLLLSLNVNPGDKLVVAVLDSLIMKAYKSDILGGKWPFNEDTLGANGNFVIPIKGNDYRMYGEMSLVSGCVDVVLTNK